MYTTINFKTKKALKEAVARYNLHEEIKATAKPLTIGALLGGMSPPPQPVTVFQPGPFGGNVPLNGGVTLEGPHYPAPHTWYATAVLKNGVVVKVS